MRCVVSSDGGEKMKSFILVLTVLCVFAYSFIDTEYVKTEAHYTVKAGDTLWYIAGQYFNKQDKERHFGEFQWKIREANAAKFADNRRLQPGDILVIPLEIKKDLRHNSTGKH